MKFLIQRIKLLAPAARTDTVEAIMRLREQRLALKEAVKEIAGRTTSAPRWTEE